MSSELFVPRRFQREAVENATAALHYCLTQVEGLESGDDHEANRQVVVARQGSVLFEAPTGIGKTYMAAATVEGLSRAHRVIWFWFAPFQGLVGQAENVLREGFPSLRVRSLADDREPTTLSPGDVFVTTWAAVATASQSSRRARQQSETLPSVDQLVTLARHAGFHIGVVIDEAHHSFRGQTQAYAFYREVLAPAVTILATATPRDAEIDGFVRAQHIQAMHRVAISRSQGVEAGLLKRGVKVAVFTAPRNVEELVDFKRTALSFGAEAHRRVKHELEASGLSVTPLLLVQVDSSEDSVDEAKRMLADLGFSEGQVRAHTADEPDPHLLTIAADETVEVLVFKMAVALGFDAPRAFTLVSMRANRDSDFGVQIVGRIMRVDRRLQLRPVPEALQFGYVFLADHASQQGMLTAAERINAIRTELSPVSQAVAVVPVGGRMVPISLGPGGAVPLFPEPSRPAQPGNGSPGGALPAGGNVFGGLFGPSGGGGGEGERERPSKRNGSPSGGGAPYSYTLRSDLHVPQPFQSARIRLDNPTLLEEIVERVRFDDAALSTSRQRTVQVLKESTEIFERRRETPESVLAELTQKEIDRRAQLTLFGADPDNMVDPRALHRALIDGLRHEFKQRGWSDMLGEEDLQVALHRILALRPQVLRQAISEALAQQIETYDVAPLPSLLESDMALAPARLNVYGVFPEMNSWEQAFAKFLDDDLSGTVLWWHRNPARKPHSIFVPLPGQPDFYPDLAVGIDGRARGHGILLVETKRIINEVGRNPQTKAQARHPIYGNIMMVFWQQEQQWMIVEYDEGSGQNALDRVLQVGLMRSY